jgi:DNA-binding MarR family transcriptional regulator
MPAVERDRVDEFVAQLAGWLPDLDLETEAAVERIQKISKRLHRELDKTLAAFGLSIGEWQVLMSLHNAEEQRRSPGALASACELSSGAMTNRIDRLEADGLVRRRPDPDDRRGVLVELTEEGRRLRVETVRVQAEKEALFASTLDKREREQLNGLLRRLMVAFEEREK